MQDRIVVNARRSQLAVDPDLKDQKRGHQSWARRFCFVGDRAASGLVARREYGPGSEVSCRSRTHPKDRIGAHRSPLSVDSTLTCRYAYQTSWQRRSRCSGQAGRLAARDHHWPLICARVTLDQLHPRVTSACQIPLSEFRARSRLKLSVRGGSETTATGAA